jgi:hypothetical protein
MGAADRLLLTADVCTWIQQRGYCWLLTYIHGYNREATVDCWYIYMGTADMLLLTADICTLQAGYCWLLTYVHCKQATVDCWHVHCRQATFGCWHMYTAGRLLLAADIHCRQPTVGCWHVHCKQATVDCWHMYTAGRLLLGADNCTLLAGYCWLLMCTHSTSTESKLTMMYIIPIYFKVAQPCCVIKYKWILPSVNTTLYSGRVKLCVLAKLVSLHQT